MNEQQAKALSTVRDYVKDEATVDLMIDILGLNEEPLEPQSGLVRTFSGDIGPINKSHSLRPRISLR